MVTTLVVDDDADMRFLASTVLKRGGIEVSGEAANGTQALEKLRELNPPPIPTVVVLDNQMPGLTGLEVADMILRDSPEQLIVLFSAFLDDKIVAEADRLGIAACVSKQEVRRLPTIVNELVAARG